MNKFEVIQPSELLAPYVKQYWILTMENVSQGFQRLVPFGSSVLTFQRTLMSDSLVNGLHPVSCMLGQSTSYNNIVFSGTISFISIVFQPVGSMLLLKTPINEMKNQSIAIDSLGDKLLVELEKYILDSMNDRAYISLIEHFLLKRIHQTDKLNHKRLTAVIQSINNRQSSVSELAELSCLGYKQFKRVFSEYIGINPKDFLRVARFQKASNTLQMRPQTTLNQLADVCNYYDVSHLIKEFKEFSGYTPGEYVSICNPYSNYHSLFRSAYIDIKN